MTNERIDELIESLNWLLIDLRRAGCHLVCLVAAPEHNGCGFHSWRGGNTAILYSLVQITEEELHDELMSIVRGETDDDTYSK
jgi:hypothetical protein